METKNDTVIADVLIGDVEGNHEKHSGYIVLNKDDYEVAQFDGIFGSYPYVELTEKGHEHFANNDFGWSTKYYNYSIVLLSKDEARKAYDEMAKERERLSKEMALLENYLHENDK